MVCLKKILFLIFLSMSYLMIQTAIAQEKQTVMNTSVRLAPNIFISTYTDKSSYCPPENITMTTEVENRGNQASNPGNLTKNVTDPNTNPFMSKIWNNTVINAGEIKYFYLYHTVTESDLAGLYTLRSNFAYDNENKSAETTFRIKQGYGTLVASPPRIEETAMPGDTIIKKVYFWLLYPCYGTLLNLNASQGPPGSWVTFTINPVWLSPEVWNMTEVRIYIDLPENTTAGDYNGYIYGIIDEKIAIYIPVTIHVLVKAVFDVTVEVLPSYKEVCQGNDVKAKVTVTKVIPPDTLDVNLTYKIELNNTVYDEKKEVVAVTTSIERQPTLRVPSYAPPGIYTFSTTLNHQNAGNVTIYAYDIFFVKECPPVAPAPGVGWIPPAPVPPPEVNLILNVSKHRISTLAGNVTGFSAYVKNTGIGTAKAVKLEIEGIPIEWLSVTPYKTNILSGATQEYLVLINVPKDAEDKVYQLKIKAVDAAESNEDVVVFIIGRDLKSLAELVLGELEKLRNTARQTLQLDCLEIKDNLALFDEAENFRGLGLVELKEEKYKDAISLFEYSSSLYERIIKIANTLMDLELDKTKPFTFPPFTDRIISSIKLLTDQTQSRNYAEFCGTLAIVKKYSLYSKISAGVIISSFMIAIVLLLRIYRKRQEMEVLLRLKKIRDRLKRIAGGEGHRISEEPKPSE